MKYDKTAFGIFANLHPVEAFDLDKEMFYKHMKSRGYKLTNEEIEKLINESR